MHFNIILPFTGAGIAQWYSTGLRGGWSGVRIPAGAGNFSHNHRVQTDSRVHLASYPVDTRGSFPGGKAVGGEADHSPPSSADAKNAWMYTSKPKIRLHRVGLS
jgi:hypothetical protein